VRWLVIAVMVMSVSAARAEHVPPASYVIVFDRSLAADKREAIDDALARARAKIHGDVALTIQDAPKGNLLAGVRAAGARLANVKSPARRVLVVTDGDDFLTVGPTVTKLRNAGIKVSALGYQSLTRITLSDIARYGGGSLYVARDRTDLVRSFEEELVPPDERDLAVVLLIDRSAWMHGEKLEMATETARSLVELLAPEDVVGVVAFDSDAEIIVPAQPASNKMAITNRIATLTSSGGTKFYPAVKDALDMLSNVQTFDKHVILISDGGSPDDGVLDIVEQLRAANVMVSVVGLPGADRAQLATIAERGNGRLYLIDDIGALPKLFLVPRTDVGR
jgi:uncharacterized protein YegL